MNFNKFDKNIFCNFKEDVQLNIQLTPNGRISRVKGSSIEIACEAQSNHNDVEVLIFKDKVRNKNFLSWFLN